MNTPDDLPAGRPRPRGAAPGLEIRGNLVDDYADVFTPEARAALAALAPLDAARREVMRARIRRRAERARNREPIRFLYLGANGVKYQREHAFEGILNNIERRYRETDSTVVREELGRASTGPPFTLSMRARAK